MQLDPHHPVEALRRLNKALDAREARQLPRFNHDMALTYQKHQRAVDAWRRGNIRRVK